MTLRLNADVSLYAILCTTRDGIPYFAERSLAEAASHATTVNDIAGGQVERVERVYCFNSAEHIADDVTEEIAIEIANQVDPREPISESLHDFIATHAGQTFVLGLQVADRTFTAA